VRAAALARASFAALVIATFLAIFYAQELKHRDPLLEKPGAGTIRFKPVGPLPGPMVHREAHFHVKATVADTLQVSVVGERSGRVVRVLVIDAPLYTTVHAFWDGRSKTGALAPPGLYALRIHFERHGQTVPAPLTLDLLGP